MTAGIFKKSETPRKSEKYAWTNHSQYKMRRYGLSAQRVKRIIRYPARTEEAIVPGLVAAMQPAGGKNYSEIWAMYKVAGSKTENQILKSGGATGGAKIKIITAWRYPGKSPARDPIPKEILDEIRELI